MSICKYYREMAGFNHIDDILSAIGRATKPIEGGKVVSVWDEMNELATSASQRVTRSIEVNPRMHNRSMLEQYNEPTVRLWRGEDIHSPEGGTFFADSRDYAQNFAGQGGRLRSVEVPTSIASQASVAARAGGNVGYELPYDWAEGAYDVPKIRKRRRAGPLPQMFNTGHSTARRGLPIRSSAPGSGILR